MTARRMEERTGRYLVRWMRNTKNILKEYEEDFTSAGLSFEECVYDC